MTDHASYTYDDSDRKLTIREMGGRVDIFVRDLDDSAMVLLPAEQRQAAAQALAGDGYRVVSAQEWKIAYDAGFEAGKKYAQQSQPGTSDRGHAVFQFDATCPKCAKAEAQAAQPDRPAPVDPSEVRVGDVVDYERKPGYETCRIVGKVDETFNFGHGISLRIHSLWWNTAPGMATVRILHRAEPEPDPAAVEALAEIVHDVNNSFESTPLTKSATNRFVRELIRRGVEVPDA